MKQQVIIEMTTDELKDRLVDLKDQLKKMKMSHAVSPLENPMVIKQKRKDIARVNTELRRRLLETESAQAKDVNKPEKA